MKFFLTSSGFRSQKLIEDFTMLAGASPHDLSVAYIPTAANIEDSDKRWLVEDLVDCVRVGFKYFDIVDIAALPQQVWWMRLLKAQVIVVGGGLSSYLYEQMILSGLAERLTELLDNRIYVGSSAGSMVVGPHITDEQSRKYFNERLGGTLNLVEFWIKPHLNSPEFPERTPEALSQIFQNPPVDVYALDDLSAISVDAGVVRIAGSGKVLCFDREDSKSEQ